MFHLKASINLIIFFSYFFRKMLIFEDKLVKNA